MAQHTLVIEVPETIHPKMIEQDVIAVLNDMVGAARVRGGEIQVLEYHHERMLEEGGH